MSTTRRQKWLTVRKTPRNLWRQLLGRYLWTGGTYVRERDASTQSGRDENARLERYARRCNRERADKIARRAKAET